MKTILCLLSLLLAVVAALPLLVAVRGVPRYDPPTLAARPAPAGTPAQLALGEKIVRGSCAECHLNKLTDRFSGYRLLDTPPEFGASTRPTSPRMPSTALGPGPMPW